MSETKAQRVQQEAREITHLGGRLPRVDGSGFVLPVLALMVVTSSAIMEVGGCDWPCSALTMRTGDGMAELWLSWYRGSRRHQLFVGGEGTDGSTCTRGQSCRRRTREIQTYKSSSFTYCIVLRARALIPTDGISSCSFKVVNVVKVVRDTGA
jgi:hypothetical protein